MIYDGVNTKPPLNDDTLQHYGVKGMKWKHHKNTDLKYRGYPSAESGKKLTFVMDRGLLVDDHYKSANRSTNKSRPISKSKKTANKKKDLLKKKWETDDLHSTRRIKMLNRIGFKDWSKDTNYIGYYAQQEKKYGRKKKR